MAKPKQPAGTPVISNRKAYRDYSIDEELEAGIVLKGCEVKMVRQGSFSLREAYCEIRDGELWLVGSHVAKVQTVRTSIDVALTDTNDAITTATSGTSGGVEDALGAARRAGVA